MPLQSISELRERLEAGEKLLSDGAIGSELIRHGVIPEDVLRANLGLTQVVRSIHERYLAAGASFLTTNTFGLRDGADWAKNVRTGLHLGVQAARESTYPAFVWMSLVPAVVPRESDMLRFLLASEAHWPHALLIETCTSLREALAATETARVLPLDLLAVTCHYRADGRMPDGTTPEEAARALTEAGADIVGANCGDAADSFVEIAARMRAVTTAPLLIQPGAGLPTQDAEGRWIYPLSAPEFARIGKELFAAGANIVGGCCGTTPAHIAALHQVMISTVAG